MTFLRRTSTLALGAAVLAAATAVVSHWGVNAESLGAHGTGMAILLGSVAAVAIVVSMYSVPLLIVAALVSFFRDRRSAIRFAVAAAVCAVPLLVLR